MPVIIFLTRFYSMKKQDRKYTTSVFEMNYRLISMTGEGDMNPDLETC